MAQNRVSTLELISDRYTIKITGILSHIDAIELHIPGQDQRNYSYTVPLNHGSIDLKVKRLEVDQDEDFDVERVHHVGQLWATQQVSLLEPVGLSGRGA